MFATLLVNLMKSHYSLSRLWTFRRPPLLEYNMYQWWKTQVGCKRRRLKVVFVKLRPSTFNGHGDVVLPEDSCLVTLLENYLDGKMSEKKISRFPFKVLLIFHGESQLIYSVISVRGISRRKSIKARGLLGLDHVMMRSFYGKNTWHFANNCTYVASYAESLNL